MNKTLFAYRNYSDKFKKVIVSRDTFKFYWKTYILSKFDKVEPDIYIVSYPKCGRTWLRVMLQKYAEFIGHTQKEFNDRSIISIADNLAVKFEHDLGNWVPAPPKLENVVFNKKKFKGKRVIFLVRDPRDVLVSSWYHLKFRENIYRKDLSSFVKDDLTGLEKVVKFFNMWVENKSSLGKFLMLTYEDLHSNSISNFRKMLEFMEIDLDMEASEKAVEESRFDKMKKMESRGSLNEPWMKPGAKSLGESMKVRKGKIGGFKKELSRKDIDHINVVIKEKLHPEILKLYRNRI